MGGGYPLRTQTITRGHSGVMRRRDGKGPGPGLGLGGMCLEGLGRGGRREELGRTFGPGLAPEGGWGGEAARSHGYPVQTWALTRGLGWGGLGERGIVARKRLPDTRGTKTTFRDLLGVLMLILL